MASSRSLPRSASELPDPPSPFSSNPAHHPVSIPTTPGLSSSSCSSFGRMRSPPTDSPPITPTKQQGGKPKPTPAVPPLPPGVETASSNGARGGSVEDKQRQRHDDCHPEVVPEKIIREDAPPVVAETAAATTTTEVEVEVESPKKGAAPVPEPIVVVAAVEDVVADKFVAVVKEAIKKPEMDEKEVAMRRFLGSRVKTAMEPRSEAEQPRRREVARSNDVIEAARTKLMQKRQCSRVKALVGAFETVIDTQKDAAAGRPQHIYRKSA
uniref:Calmodulin-binding domain-containing protein n=1 Tax=Zea mays TaxID=4577 RepID=A0A804U7J4_MAIZE